MNNSQFRRLVLDTPRRQDGETSTPRPAAPSTILGSRTKSSIPMTPRTVKGAPSIDFARQLAERDASSQPQKKFRSSAAPKGTKLAAGYRDRTLDRTEDDEDDVAARIKALEESMKLGQIDRETFEKLRDEILGGDVSKTHLVKGLDRKLLERVRRGEDVLSGNGQTAQKEQENVPEPEPEPAVDEELDRLEQKEMAPVVREVVEKKGQMGPPPPVAGVKRSRDAILAELKAARQAAAEAKATAQPQLGPKFRKVGEKRETSRIERDAKGREVLITVDEDGNIKRKVRRTEQGAQRTALLMPDKDAIPLGMEVPEIIPAANPTEDEDVDIFDKVGHEYDPLAELGDEDGASISEDDDKPDPGDAPQRPSDPAAAEPKVEDDAHRTAPPELASETSPLDSTTPSTMLPPLPRQPQRNYFNDKPASPPPGEPSGITLSDPTILAALRKTRDMSSVPTRADSSTRAANDEDADEEEMEARLRRRAAMLASSDRDMQDLDLGFGSSRFDDAEDLDEGASKVKLSQWKGSAGTGNDDEDGGGRDGGKSGQKRKTGQKKRKGDKNSAADVLKVIEARKGAGK